MSDLMFGLQITVLGMGLVFGLLALLWGLLALAARLEPGGAAPRPVATADVPPLETAAGEAEAPAPAADAPALLAGLLESNVAPAVRVRGPGAEDLEPEALAAIAAAVVAHAANRRRQAAPETRSYWPGSLLFASRWVAAGRARQTRGYQRERR